MGRSKPRTNKRPPPKARKSESSTYFDPTRGLFPHPSTLDPSDPSFPSAFKSWSNSALSQFGQLAQLPRLSPSQLSAIAGAAAGVGDGLFSTVPVPQVQGLPIDLPASLAALFEAKLTLDREKAKLMRMQKELKGYREGVSAVGAAMATVKGKEVAIDDECTCGRNGHAHEYPGSAHSDEDYYYYDTEEECCDCCSHDHSYIECEHEPGDCDCEYEDEEDIYTLTHSEHHGPHHTNIGVAREEYSDDEYEYDEHPHGHPDHRCYEPRRRLADDPERMDEAVHELFNWIKAVVWTIEQAAIVAGRGWANTQSPAPAQAQTQKTQQSQSQSQPQPQSQSQQR